MVLAVRALKVVTARAARAEGIVRATEACGPCTTNYNYCGAKSKPFRQHFRVEAADRIRCGSLGRGDFGRSDQQAPLILLTKD